MDWPKLAGQMGWPKKDSPKLDWPKSPHQPSKTPPKFHEKTRETQKRTNMVTGEKKSAKFWAPPPHPSFPIFLGPTFSGFGVTMLCLITFQRLNGSRPTSMSLRSQEARECCKVFLTADAAHIPHWDHTDELCHRKRTRSLESVQGSVAKLTCSSSFRPPTTSTTHSNEIPRHSLKRRAFASWANVTQAV